MTLFIIILLAVIWKLLNDFVFKLVWADYTGFGQYGTTIIDPKTNQIQEIQLNTRTLWDLLELLIIPAVLVVGGFYLNKSERDNDRKIATDRQRETILQSYFDRMTELLLEKGLRNSKPDEDIHTVARTLTISTILSLDSSRNNLLFRFLSESKLVIKENPILKLDYADLRNSDLVEVNLSEFSLVKINLSGTNLHKSYFCYSNMRQAILEKADLSGAYLWGTDLSKANLINAILIGTDMSDVILNGAIVCNANFFKANLWRVKLCDANMIGADFSFADLHEADLQGAKVTLKQLAQAASLEGVTLPDGTIFHGNPKDILKMYPPQTLTPPEPDQSPEEVPNPAPDTNEQEEQ